jgi:hypothetical protein
MHKFSKDQELQIKEAINREGYYGSIAYNLFRENALKINDKDSYHYTASLIHRDIRGMLYLDSHIIEYLINQHFRNYYGSKVDNKKELFLDYIKSSLEDLYRKDGTSIADIESSAIGALPKYFADIDRLSEKDFNTYFKKTKKFEAIYDSSQAFLKRIRNLDYIDDSLNFGYDKEIEINYDNLFNVISSIKKYNLQILSMKRLINSILIASLNKITIQHQKTAKNFLQNFYIGLPILFIFLAFFTTLSTSAILCLLVIMFLIYPLGTYHKYLEINTIYNRKEDALFSTVINYAKAMTEKGISIPSILQNVCTHLENLDDFVFPRYP